MKRSIISVVFIAFLASPAFPQLTGNNLMELQGGNVPSGNPADLITHYNRTNLMYRYKNLRASLRYEHFVHPESSKEYHKITQYSLNYRNKGLELKLGHFNETLGNGILLRSYEIPGSVFEGQAYRVRYGFYRDLRGFMGSYNHKFFSLKILRARSLLNLLPPTLDEKNRRIDLSEAIQMETRFLKQNLGVILLRNHNSGKREDFGSVFLKGNIIGGLSYNMEFARQFNDGSYFYPGETSSYAIYGSLNYSYNRTGISFEYKDYKNMFIGAGISDPPTLVREQSYRVLNRSIHVPELSDESGVQLEIFQSLKNGNLLTFNYAYTKNELFKEFIFQEFFVEYEMSIRKFDVLRFFLDYSRDPLRLEDNRYSGGFLYEGYFKSGLGASLQAEYQYFERDVSTGQKVNNGVIVTSVYKPSSWSAGLTLEISTDPIQTAIISEDLSTRLWPGITGSYYINKNNKVTLFAGKRRGGPACSSGICYEVLDFEGIEIRLTTKF